VTQPNKDDINQRLLELRETSAPLHAQWTEVDKYLDGTFQIWDTDKWEAAANWEQYHPSLPWAIYSRARDRMTTAVPTARRRVWGNNQRRKLVADEKIEPWANEGMKYMLRIDPAPKLAWANGMAYGLQVLEGPVLDPMWRQYDSEMKTYWPARLHAPHPATVLLDPLGPTMPRDVFKFSVISAAELRAMIGSRRETRGDLKEPWENDDKKNPFVTIGEYWTLDTHALFVYGESPPRSERGVNVDAMQGGVGRLIFIEQNNWGFVPFAQSPTFWGKVKSNATLQEAWAQTCTGMIDPLKKDLLVDAIGQSAVLHMLLETAMMGYQTQSDPGEMEQAVRKGRFIRTNVPDDLKPFPSKDIKPAMFEYFSNIRQRIEEASHTKQLGGFPEANVNTLGQTMVNIAEATKSFAFPQERLAVVMGTAMSNLLRFQVAMIDHYEKPMRIMGLDMSQKDIGGDYNMEVEFRVVDTVLKMQNEEAVIAKLRAGVIDMETARTEMGYENIVELEKRSLKEQVQRSPEVMAEALAGMAKQLGYLKAAAMFEQEGAQMRQQREMAGVAAPPGENGSGEGGTMPMSETPTNPVRDQGPAGMIRRDATGREKLGV